jgi:hypothetical protein
VFGRFVRLTLPFQLFQRDLRRNWQAAAEMPVETAHCKSADPVNKISVLDNKL